MFQMIPLLKTINLSYCIARLVKNKEVSPPSKNGAFCVSTKKMTHFSDLIRIVKMFILLSLNLMLKNQKKYRCKNFHLSFTIFLWWAIQNCDFYSQLIEEFKKKNQNFNCNSCINGSRYSTATCFKWFLLSRRSIWAIVEPDWTKNKEVSPWRSGAEAPENNHNNHCFYIAPLGASVA